jgi:hypothetical protein
MKFLTYAMILLALCCSMQCGSMTYYGPPAFGRAPSPAPGTRVMTQQEYQAYLAQQAQQKAAPAATQPPPIPQPQPAPAQPVTQTPERQTKVGFSNQPPTKTTPVKYYREQAEEDAAAASVNRGADEDEEDYAMRQRQAIRRSKWSSVSEQVAAEEALDKEQKARTSTTPEARAQKAIKQERQQHMQDLGIPLEKTKKSFW